MYLSICRRAPGADVLRREMYIADSQSRGLGLAVACLPARREGGPRVAAQDVDECWEAVETNDASVAHAWLMHSLRQAMRAKEEQLVLIPSGIRTARRSNGRDSLCINARLRAVSVG